MSKFASNPTGFGKSLSDYSNYSHEIIWINSLFLPKLLISNHDIENLFYLFQSFSFFWNYLVIFLNIAYLLFIISFVKNGQITKPSVCILGHFYPYVLSGLIHPKLRFLALPREIAVFSTWNKNKKYTMFKNSVC